MSGLRRAGSRLVLTYGPSVYTVPLDPSPSLEYLGRAYRLASDGPRTWVIEYDPESGRVARTLDGELRYVVPMDSSVSGVLADDRLVVNRDQFDDHAFVADADPELALLDPRTGRRQMIDAEGGDVLGVGSDTVVWTHYDGVMWVWRAGRTRAVPLPDGWSAAQGVRVTDDGTLAVPLMGLGPTTRVVVLPPSAEAFELVAERDGSTVELCWADGWLFWSVGVFGAPRGITAHHPASGRSLSVRLPTGVQTFVARAT